jgi:5-methylcytosine-specific restriction enzyme subunit McrC
VVELLPESPFSQLSGCSRKHQGDFFEVLIYLFSKYTRRLFQSSLYQAYEDISRELPYIKGKLDVPALSRKI